MEGNRIREINHSLKELELQLKSDDIVVNTVQLLVFRLREDDRVTVVIDWTDATDFEEPTIEAHGRTPINKGMHIALKKSEEQKIKYKANRIPYFRTWLFLITYGGPTDEIWLDITRDCVIAGKSDKLSIFVVGTKDADFKTLKNYSIRAIIEIDELKFEEFFLWLSESALLISRSGLGAEVQLPQINWGKVII